MQMTCGLEPMTRNFILILSRHIFRLPSIFYRRNFNKNHVPPCVLSGKQWYFMIRHTTRKGNSFQNTLYDFDYLKIKV